ncbi:MAG: peptidoglycan D,D-transpeptidase FtsI family protein [Phycisphaerales bacterium JB059]
MDLSRLIPSMFHRRLALLMAAMVFVSLLLSGKLAHLTLVQGAQRRADAEAKLVRRSWTPTYRGRILDRKGRVLAHDRASYDVAVDYRVMTGEWAERESRRLARAAHRKTWGDLEEGERDALIALYREKLDRHVDEMWVRLSEISGVEPGLLVARARTIVERVEAMHDRLVEARIASLSSERQRKGLRTDEDDLRRLRARANQRIAEQRQAHVLIEGVDDEVGFELERLVGRTTTLRAGGTEAALRLELMPGLEVRNTTRRAYPWDEVAIDVDLSKLPGPLRREGYTSIRSEGVAWHLLGRMRRTVYAEDVERRSKALESDEALRERSVDSLGYDLGEYQDGDNVGAAGLEYSFEDRLRGVRGVRSENLLTGEIRERDPLPGEDVELTIDIMLQARIRALMDPRLGLAIVQSWHHNEQVELGTPLNGAAVVLDIDSGDILALVSTPGIPRGKDWREQGFDSEQEYERALALDAPYTNRAIAKPYPPGSIVKPLMVCAAAHAGKVDPGVGIVCTGHLLPGKTDSFRCWIYKQYGMTHSPDGQPLDGAEAVKHSCNIFFYEAGRRLGARGIAEAYRAIGLGEGFGLGIGPEFPGAIGAFDNDNSGAGLQVWDTILMGIGQGPVAWTPLHAADALATLVRGGRRIAPHLVRGAPKRDLPPVPMPDEARRLALLGLHGSVSDADGTGHAITYSDGRRLPIFDVPGVSVWGKTGTATAPDLSYDPDGDGPLPSTVEREGDHSWFVVLVAPEGEAPRYAVAVVMEYAGSGGRVSGPIANQIIRALVQEGYLPEVDPDAEDRS